MVVCDSDATADALVNQSTDVVEAWLHPNHPDLITGKRVQKPGRGSNVEAMDAGVIANTKYEIRTIQHRDGIGQYCVLIHGATDADVSITKFQYSTLQNVAAVGNDRGTSVAIEGSIEISEPRGISFLNTIILCCNALGRDPATSRFMIKTFFIGTRGGDSPGEPDVIETITNVKPLKFTILNLTGSFTPDGGVYSMSIVGAVNGQSRLPQFDKLDKSLSMRGNTLNDVIANIQQNINTTYDKLYNCVLGQAKLSEEALGYKPGVLSDPNTGALKRVQYVVELHPYYQSPRYKFTSSSQQAANSDGTCKDTGNVSNGKDFGIESALNLMMQSCQRVELDGSTGIEEAISLGRAGMIPVGTKVQYRVHTSVENNKPGSSVAAVVKYRVEPFPVPRGIMEIASDPNSELAQRLVLPRTIHFDYMYTGKNVDILEFDMKLNMGMAYLMMGTVVNSFKTQGQPTASATKAVDGSVMAAAATRMTNTPVDIPVMFTTMVDLPPRRTTPDPVATHGNIWNMSKQASVESIGVSMKITGNLWLLESVNDSMMQLSDAVVDNSGEMIYLEWGRMPGFAKINIKMPSSNDDIALFNSKDQSYATPFWYDGYYYIMGVEHVFEDGDFVQNVQLISMPKIDSTEGNNTTAATSLHNADKSTFSDNVLDCFNDRKCGKSDGKTTGTKQEEKNRKSTLQSPGVDTAKKMATPTSPMQVPSRSIDTIVSTMSVDNVVGWNTMPPAVRDAIISETKGDRIPTSVYAMFAMIESSGKATAVSKTGATGVFQFTTKTWNALMPSDRIIPGAPDPRLKPELSARAAKLYLNQISRALGGTTEPTWLYMGHNLGQTAATIIYRQSQMGNNRPLSEIYKANPGFPDWDKFAANNHYSPNSTTFDIRDQIAGKFIPRIIPKPSKAQDNKAVDPPKTTPAAPYMPPAAMPTAGQAITGVTRMCATPIAAASSNASGNAEPKAAKLCGSNQEPAEKTEDKK